MAKFAPLVQEEITGRGGFQYRYDFYHGDLTVATLATAQTLPVFTPKAIGGKILHVAFFLDEAFQNTLDATNNSTLVTVGDTGTPGNLIASIQCNANGTLGIFPASDTGTLPYTVPNPILGIVVTVTPGAGKNVLSLNKGHAHVVFNILDVSAAGALPQVGNEVQ